MVILLIIDICLCHSHFYAISVSIIYTQTHEYFTIIRSRLINDSTLEQWISEILVYHYDNRSYSDISHAGYCYYNNKILNDKHSMLLYFCL